MSAVDFHDVEAGFGSSFRSGGKASGQAFYFFTVQYAGVFQRRPAGNEGNQRPGAAGNFRQSIAPAVAELDTYASAVFMHGPDQFSESRDIPVVSDGKAAEIRQPRVVHGSSFRKYQRCAAAGAFSIIGYKSVRDLSVYGSHVRQHGGHDDSVFQNESAYAYR